MVSNNTKSYKLDDPDELFGCMRISKDQSGLPVDIFVDDCDSYIQYNHPLCVYAVVRGENTTANYFPISVSSSPTILDPQAPINMTNKGLNLIKHFVYNNRKLLFLLAKNRIDHIKFINYMVCCPKN